MNIHTAILRCLMRNGFTVSEMADVAGPSHRGMLYDVTDRLNGTRAVVAITAPIAGAEIAARALDVAAPPDAHPGVPASLYMVPGPHYTDPNV